ncbi:hypothetical protein [Mediterraneibacter hominis]
MQLLKDIDRNGYEGMCKARSFYILLLCGGT